MSPRALATHPGQRPVQVMTYAGTIGAAALLSAILWPTPASAGGWWTSG
ncbi:MAG TPA: hypothetical protein VKV80_01915 [Streptosporangiaceae bacterium]|nr:hypothetical protein [Streptosporangiaceae bacterium]